MGKEGCGIFLGPGADADWKDPVPGCSGVLVPCVLQVGPSLDSYWSESGGVTCGLRSENTPGRPAPSGKALRIEGCKTAFVLGADGNQRLHLYTPVYPSCLLSLCCLILI